MKFVLFAFFSAIALAALVQSQVEWTPWSGSQGNLRLKDAGGRDSDGRPLYIIRASKGADPWIPGKLIADWGLAWIPIDGQEFLVKDFEVICCDSERLASNVFFRFFKVMKPVSHGCPLLMAQFLPTQLWEAS